MSLDPCRPLSFAAAAWFLFAFAAAGWAGDLPDFRVLVKENSSAVVNISTVQKPGDRDKTEAFGVPLPELPEEGPLGDFFRKFFGERPGGPGAEQDVRSLGSGFIISADGYVLTNAHAVAEAETIIVRLSDHRERRATLIGKDERSDVALLKIDATGLPTVRIGDSDRLEVGEWVLAIGSPFGLEYTATQGIVSALGRSLPGDTYVPFIQTDVAVNPGNSGGPLFNVHGEVVGLNAQIFSETGGYMGLSFAIPINVAMQVVEQLRTRGEVVYGWLGVRIQPLSQDLAEAFHLDRPRGALVTEVTPDSPAQRAGIASGDVILAYGGVELEWYSELPRLVGSTPVGRIVPLTVLRDGQVKEVQVTIAKLEEEEGGGTAEVVSGLGSGAILGMRVTDLSAQQRKQLGVEEEGVLVEQVSEGPAEEAGLREGDVILALDGQAVKSASDLRERIKALPAGKAVAVLVQREDGPMFLALRLPPAK